jgi:hypothetical protein
MALFFQRVVDQARAQQLISDEQFTVDGTAARPLDPFRCVIEMGRTQRQDERSSAVPRPAQIAQTLTSEWTRCPELFLMLPLDISFPRALAWTVIARKLAKGEGSK